jgi:hypothetical protein
MISTEQFFNNVGVDLIVNEGSSMKDSLQQIKKGAETAGKSTPDFPGS